MSSRAGSRKTASKDRKAARKNVRKARQTGRQSTRTAKKTARRTTKSARKASKPKRRTRKKRKTQSEPTYKKTRNKVHITERGAAKIKKNGKWVYVTGALTGGLAIIGAGGYYYKKRLESHQVSSLRRLTYDGNCKKGFVDTINCHDPQYPCNNDSKCVNTDGYTLHETLKQRAPVTRLTI